MGAYLSEPITEKHSTDEGNEFLSCGASSMQGWRMSQEVIVLLMKYIIYKRKTIKMKHGVQFYGGVST